ncbi:type II toxin-antitoxin system ParD family antitoxin [Mesorhizobium sp. YIM 152430]|uniref:type II toxin-antitoxin system ParD family antitoxin n=1 Tax=Mesorhizobium sp. YIM 152430 TaxID=3031761 RepID=UPI0023DAAF53|nr:type II toxin-antitoxin system ParD family antitoxin [Mesorhizobium sp. YIM 152430]MDF1601015.1 type II toxin-antitoxin system ParD family antitoxin [Mesorhizobium sp. YIM 152430]
MAVSAELGTHLEQFVAKLVSSGRYNSKSEVLRDGLRLLEEREAKLAVLDAMVAEGLADIDAGRVHDAEDVFDELEAEIRALAVSRS